MSVLRTYMASEPTTRCCFLLCYPGDVGNIGYQSYYPTTRTYSHVLCVSASNPDQRLQQLQVHQVRGSQIAGGQQELLQRCECNPIRALEFDGVQSDIEWPRR